MVEFCGSRSCAVLPLIAIAWLISVLTSSGCASCLIDGEWDIIWVLDGANGPLGNDGIVAASGTIDRVRGFVANFTSSSLVLAPDKVHQGFVQFGGPYDTDSQTDAFRHTIGPMLNLTEEAAINQILFEGRLQDLRVLNGSNNLAGALDFVAESMLPMHGRRNIPKIVFLLTDSGPTNTFGLPENISVLSQAVFRLKSAGNVHLVLVYYGNAVPEAPFADLADRVFRTSLLSLNADLIQSNALCFLSSMSKPSPALTTDIACLSLFTEGGITVGQVCSDIRDDAFTLQYEINEGWELSQTFSWVGSDPTSLPYDDAGIPVAAEFPHNGSFVTIPLRELQLDYSCEVFTVPMATVMVASDGPVVSEPFFQVSAGDVQFNDRTSSMIFKTIIPNCIPSATPTKSPSPPTSSPTVKQTNTPSRSPTSPSPVPFDFDIFYTAETGDLYRRPIAAAVAKFKRFFIKDYATYVCFEAGSSVCEYTFPERTCIDDIALFISVKSIDGNGGSVANSAPCVAGSELEQIRAGVITLDVDDILSPSFESNLMHQLMHVIGFGSRWREWGIVSSSEPLSYIGVNGVNGFHQVGGLLAAPLELESDGFHWKEAVFKDELMTLSLDRAEANPMSKMSLMSLKDLGFTVDENLADLYFVPIPSSRRRLLGKRSLQQTVNMINDIQLIDVGYTNWTLKTGRETDLQLERDFAQANFKGKPTVPPSPSPTPTEIGIIVGVVLACLFLCFLLFLVFNHRRKNRSSQKAREVKRKEEDVAEPTVIVKAPDSPARTRGNWAEKNDNGKTFWINEETGEFSWTPPEAFKRQQEPAAVRRPSTSEKNVIRIPNGGTWEELQDDDGNTYWHNEQTGEFSWVAPTSPSSSKAATFNTASPIQRINSSSYAQDDSYKSHSVVASQSASPNSSSNYNGYASYKSTNGENHDSLVPSQPDSPTPSNQYEEQNGVEEFNDSLDENTQDSEDDGAADQDLEANVEEPDHIARDYLPVPVLEEANVTGGIEHSEADDNDDQYNTQSLPHYSARGKWDQN